MSLQPISQRVATDLVFVHMDRSWASHELPVDYVRIPPQLVPDQDAEFNLLIQQNELWQETRPADFCFDHSHSRR